MLEHLPHPLIIFVVYGRIIVAPEEGSGHGYSKFLCRTDHLMARSIAYREVVGRARPVGIFAGSHCLCPSAVSNAIIVLVTCHYCCVSISPSGWFYRRVF